tara:strand:+ start:656 stop:1411 length:756 start_codon:yes stop_codon:yes gene_type:complete
MKLIDEIHLSYPFYGRRRICVELERQGYIVNHKRVRRLMSNLGIYTFYPRPKTTKTTNEHKKFPYLLRDVSIRRVNQVWSSDITYIPITGGYTYLTAVLDWHSRYVLAWTLSSSMESQFCCDTLLEALRAGKPEVFNTDQGVQYTSISFINELSSRDIAISMDGKGRALDNIFIERLWRSVKQEEVYLKQYDDLNHAYDSLVSYFNFYNNHRPHQSLNYRTPREVFHTGNNNFTKEVTGKHKQKHKLRPTM